MAKKNDFDPQCITYSQMNMIFNARIYYRRLTTWTRTYLFSRYYGVGTAEELFSRLYLESIDIGNMLQIIFGRQNSEQYSQMVSQFPIALRDIITAQLEGNTEAINRNINRLYQNVAERAAFLESINPYWSESGYIDLFNTYIHYILEIANSLSSGDFRREIEQYDQLTAHTNRMGDVFAQGLYDYITSDAQPAATPPVDQQCITYEEMNVIYEIRMFWFELAVWIRNYMLGRYLGIGNIPEVYERLRRVPVDYINRLREIFGDRVPEDYVQLFLQYFDLLSLFITAQMQNNEEELNRITQLLYRNADQRAAAITAINPDFWSESEWRDRLYNNLRSTIDESTSFLRGDYARNIDIFSTILDQAESTSSYFAQGLFQYLNTFQ